MSASRLAPRRFSMRRILATGAAAKACVGLSKTLPATSENTCENTATCGFINKKDDVGIEIICEIRSNRIVFRVSGLRTRSFSQSQKCIIYGNVCRPFPEFDLDDGGCIPDRLDIVRD